MLTCLVRVLQQLFSRVDLNQNVPYIPGRCTVCFQQFIQSIAHSLIHGESFSLSWNYFHFMTECRFSISDYRQKSGHTKVGYIHISMFDPGIICNHNMWLKMWDIWFKIFSFFKIFLNKLIFLSHDERQRWYHVLELLCKNLSWGTALQGYLILLQKINLCY